MREKGGVQLPDDVIATGYREIKPFTFAQVFRSPSSGFEGTEEEFVERGLGYRFRQVGKFERIVEDVQEQVGESVETSGKNEKKEEEK